LPRLSSNVPITLQHQQFQIPFYLFPIEGVDVVLGMSWLRTLGLITADFSISYISFTHNHTTITLQGEPRQNPTPASYHQLCNDVHTSSIASLHLLTFQPIDPLTTSQNSTTQTDTNNPSGSAEIIGLLAQYPTVFKPPPRPTPTTPT